MKYLNAPILLFFIFLLQGCGGKKTSNANIFERKEVEENRLMIKYAFLVDGKAVIDSAIIENRVLNTDSIPVMYNPDNPSENNLQLPK